MMKTSACLDKIKVVELEILYNSGVNGAPDQLFNDGLCPKYFLTSFFFLNFILLLGRPWAHPHGLGGPWGPQISIGGPWAPQNEIL